MNALVKTFFKVRGIFMGNIIPVRGTKVRGGMEKDILERQVSSLLTLNKLGRTFSLLSYCFLFFFFHSSFEHISTESIAFHSVTNG